MSDITYGLKNGKKLAGFIIICLLTAIELILKSCKLLITVALITFALGSLAVLILFAWVVTRLLRLLDLLRGIYQSTLAKQTMYMRNGRAVGQI